MAELPVFRSRVASVVAGDAWVIDGGYSAVRDLIWPRADTVVWLDYPLTVILPRLVARIVARIRETGGRKANIGLKALDDATRAARLRRQGKPIPLALRLRLPLWERLVLARVRAASRVFSALAISGWTRSVMLDASKSTAIFRASDCIS